MTDRRGPWVAAVTGGIASGKSAVTERFAALGASVVDADQAARSVVAPGTPALEEIVEAFGEHVRDANGGLDRRAMRQLVFHDAAARARLEGIVHPAIQALLHDRVARAAGPYCLLALPLLAETWPRYAWVDRILVVDAPESLRIQRLMARDDVDADVARAMLAAQAPRAERLALADDVIDNVGAPSQLDAQVEALHRRYLELAVAALAGA